MFNNPHGFRHPRLERSDPNAAISAIEDGLPHLVDQFYGQCNTLRQMGIRVIVMLGSPDANNQVITLEELKWVTGNNLCKDNYLTRGFHDAVLYPEDSNTAIAIEDYNQNTFGAVIGDVPNPTDHNYWMTKNYPICVTESKLKSYFYSGGNPNTVGQTSGNYPAWRSANWTGYYGNANWIIAIEPTSFDAISGTNTPYSGTGNVTGWVTTLATGCKNLATHLGPNTVILLPNILWQKSGEMTSWFNSNMTTGLFWR